MLPLRAKDTLHLGGYTKSIQASQVWRRMKKSELSQVRLGVYAIQRGKLSPHSKLEDRVYKFTCSRHSSAKPALNCPSEKDYFD